jgi:hypothetical protein
MAVIIIYICCKRKTTYASSAATAALLVPMLPIVKADLESFPSLVKTNFDHSWYMGISPFVAPVFALFMVLILLNCICKTITKRTTESLLVIFLLSLPITLADYTFSAVLPINNQITPQSYLVERKGFAPTRLTLTSKTSVLHYQETLDYWTCEGKTTIPPIKIKCCDFSSSNTCPPQKEVPEFSKYPELFDYRCEVHTGVNKFAWGGAGCFCGNENSQVTKAATLLSDSCLTDRAYVMLVTPTALTITTDISFGTILKTINITADGRSTTAQPLTITLGPASTIFNPLPTKVVIKGGVLYTYDAPNYGQGLPGTFGDIAARDLTTYPPKDFYGNSGVVISRPTTKKPAAQVAYKNSGYRQFLNDHAKDYTSLPYSCKAIINSGALPSVQVEGCTVGNLPFQITLPDSQFLPENRATSITSASCTASAATYGVAQGATLVLSGTADSGGDCIITSNCPLSNTAISIPAGTFSININASVASPTTVCNINICSYSLSCTVTASPPQPHVSITGVYNATDSGTIWDQLTNTSTWVWTTVIVTTLIIAASALAIYCLCCRSTTVTSVTKVASSIPSK